MGYGARVTLDNAPIGTTVVVAAAQLSAPRTRRLAELGLRPGATVHVLRRTAGGGRILALQQARIAVDRWVLRRLAVAPAPPPGTVR